MNERSFTKSQRDRMAEAERELQANLETRMSRCENSLSLLGGGGCRRHAAIQ
jgi:hypothetical protein